jgi:hypothetical protein
MKFPKMDLETQVLILAVGACVYGALRLAHVLPPLSGMEDVRIFAFAGMILAGQVNAGRRGMLATAVCFICMGMAFGSNPFHAASKIMGFVEGVILFACGFSALVCGYCAIRWERFSKHFDTKLPAPLVDS